jgi:hypothetical protein
MVSPCINSTQPQPVVNVCYLGLTPKIDGGVTKPRSQACLGSKAAPSCPRKAATSETVAEKGGLTLIARTHLTYNRLEFTLFFGKA